MIYHPAGDTYSQLPFRLRSFSLSFILLAFICMPAFAEDDVKPISDDAKSLVKQGEKLIRKGDFGGAEQMFKLAMEARPTDPEIKLKLAYLYVKTRRFVEAYELSFPVVREDPKNSYAFAVVGATYLGAGRFRDARMLLVNSIRLKNDQPLAWAGLGMLDFYENKIQESLKNLEEAVYYDPFEPDFLYALAQVSARAEKYKEAAAAYDSFLRVSRNTDDERRARIKGLINFLRYLGNKQSLYQTGGEPNTEVMIELVGNRPIIQLRINGRPEPLNFVLDTGSGISVISDEAAKELGIKAITKGGFAKGIGGDGKFAIVYGFIRDVDIGAVTVRNVPVYIRKFHSYGKIH